MIDIKMISDKHLYSKTACDIISTKRKMNISRPTGNCNGLYVETVEHRTETGCIFFVQPFHRSRSPQTPKIRRLRAFSMHKLPDWTRSIDTCFLWQNPPNAPIFVNIPTAAVWYIIKKASANFRKRTVLYRVPRIVTGGEKKCIFFVQPCCVDKNT